MQLHEILRILNGRIVNNTDNPELELTSGGAADLMSDVLAFTTDGNSLLFTGLTNQQVVRTAEMANVGAIVFVRGKQPPSATIELADELHRDDKRSRHGYHRPRTGRTDPRAGTGL